MNKKNIDTIIKGSKRVMPLTSFDNGNAVTTTDGLFEFKDLTTAIKFYSCETDQFTVYKDADIIELTIYRNNVIWHSVTLKEVL